MKKTGLIFILVALLAGAAGAPVLGDNGASTTTYQTNTRFDSIPSEEFFRRRAFSLDHYFELLPGYFLERVGPIGAEARFSRYGMGRGRGALYLGNVPLNDPQTDQTPFNIFPMTAVGNLVLDRQGENNFSARTNIEGAVQIVEPSSMPGKPETAIRLSKGDRELKQRRIRFSSAHGTLGADLAYDELLNDGYPFDSRGLIGGSDFGRFRTRTVSLNVRGSLPEGDSYRIGFRKFQKTFDGDLNGSTREHRRSGHIGLIEGSFGPVETTVFQRGYKVTVPDSVTKNQTTGFYAVLPIQFGDNDQLSFDIGYEDIIAKQRMQGVETDERLGRSSAGVSGAAGFGRGFRSGFGVTVKYDVGLSSNLGGHFSVAKDLGNRNTAQLEVRRTFRAPNLGELFLPDHGGGTGSTRVIGNRYVKGESAFETSAKFLSKYRHIQNEFRVVAMNVRDPILPTMETIGSTMYVRPVNGDSEDLRVVEDRVRVAGRLLSIDYRLTGGVEFASGERREFFRSVPDWRSVISMTLARSLFRNSSELFLTGEYQYSGARAKGTAQEVAPFNVLNLILDARIVDARLYIMMLNVLDEKYETITPFLMTPRTFVYGISWTLFD